MARTKITPKPSIHRRWELAARGLYKTYSMAARRSAPGVGGMKIKRRARPGAKALREIKKFQETAELLIPRAPFDRLIRELIRYEIKPDIHFTRSAYVALQEATEAYLVRLFESAYDITMHIKHTTLTVRDLRLAKKIMEK
jgi:histone H3/H4